MARLVRVSRQTIERFESDPMSIGRRRRSRVMSYYMMLRRHLADLDELAHRLAHLDEDDEHVPAAAE